MSTIKEHWNYCQSCLLTKPSLRRTAIFLALLYAIGLLGLASPYRAQWLPLTPLLLLITAALLFQHHPVWSKSFVYFCAIAWLLSFLLEVLGVQTGHIFGTYRYGTHLGWCVGGVPLLIGLNWLMLVYAVGNMLAPLPSSSTLKSVLGAALLVVLDGLMEPVAWQVGFWAWDSTQVPWQNYATWYLLAGALLQLFYATHTPPHNPFGVVVYTILLTFFGILGLLL